MGWVLVFSVTFFISSNLIENKGDFITTEDNPKKPAGSNRQISRHMLSVMLKFKGVCEIHHR